MQATQNGHHQDGADLANLEKLELQPVAGAVSRATIEAEWYVCAPRFWEKVNCHQPGGTSDD